MLTPPPAPPRVSFREVSNSPESRPQTIFKKQTHRPVCWEYFRVVAFCWRSLVLYLLRRIFFAHRGILVFRYLCFGVLGDFILRTLGPVAKLRDL